MPTELDVNSYKLRFEKLAALVLIATTLWFFSGDTTRGYGFLSDYFRALKLGVCILSAIVGIRVFTKGILGPALLCGLVVLAYNPFFPLKLDQNSWRAVHLASAISFVWVLWRLLAVSKMMTPERLARMRLAEQRAGAINEALENGDLDREQYDAFIKKLTGSEGAPSSGNGTPPRNEPSRNANKEEVIHSVVKDPPLGLPRTKENTLITGEALRITGQDGKSSNTIRIYAAADPLTMVEASSAIYWHDEIDEGKVTGSQALDWLHDIEQRTPQNYINVSSKDPHPGKVAITTGLARISLHYAIAHLDQLPLPKSTMNWMASERARAKGFEREEDCKKADHLKEALAAGNVSPVFLSHLRAAVGADA